MAGTDPTLDEFDNSSIDPAWTQGGFDMTEDGLEGGTVNFAADTATQRGELWQEYPDAGDYTTTMDLVIRVKLDTTMVQGGDEYYTKGVFSLWDNDITMEINLGWIAGRYFNGDPNLGADRFVIQRYYITAAEDERSTIELPAPITNDWCLLRYAHVDAELRMFFSPDPFTQWYDITNPEITNLQGQVGGSGAYGWGLAIAHRQAHATDCDLNYRGYTDYMRDSSGFGAAIISRIALRNALLRGRR